MSEMELTNDERRCLQMWFRQAIATLETQELAAQLARRDKIRTSPSGHRTPVSHRHRHLSHAAHSKETAVS